MKKHNPGCQCCGNGSCQICVTVNNSCSNTAINGMTVSAYFNSTVVGNCVTNSNGQCCIDISGNGAGSYDLIAHNTGFNNSNQTVNATCNTSVTMSTTSNSIGHTFVVRSACTNAGLANATVSINGGTYVTDANGSGLVFSLPTGTHPYTVTASRFNSGNGNFVVNGCLNSSITVTLGVANGYQCICKSGSSKCMYPVPKTTLSLTDSVLGSTTLTWDNTNGFYEGYINAYAYGGWCLCPSGTPDVRYRYDLLCGLGIRFSANPVTGCPQNSNSTVTLASFNVTATNCQIPFAASGTGLSCDCVANSCVNTTGAYRLWLNTNPTFTITE